MRENLGSIDTVDTHVCATSFKQRKEHFVTCKALYLVRSTYVYASTRPVKTVEQMVVQPKSNNSPMELAVIWEASETQATEMQATKIQHLTEMQQPKCSNQNAATKTQWPKHRNWNANKWMHKWAILIIILETHTVILIIISVIFINWNASKSTICILKLVTKLHTKLAKIFANKHFSKIPNLHQKFGPT